MHRKIGPLVALSLSCLLAVSAGAAERRRSSAPPPPPQYRVDVPTRSMEITRVALGISTGTTIGQMRPTCTLIGAEGYRRVMLYPSHAFSQTYVQDFRGIFAEEARAAGYQLPGTTGNLFETEASQAELHVGVGITGLTANGCTGAVLIVEIQEVEVSLAIDWQVYEPLEKKIIFRGTSTGIGKISNNRPNDTIVMEGTRAAFKDAAKTILADPNFVAAVTDRRGAPVASQVAPAAPTTVQVAHLPLSKVPFRQQVNDLRKQVITIVTPSGGGSGFYIADGLVLTNEHVIGGFKDVKVKFMGGREVAGQVIASDARRDVALVQTEHVGVPGLPLRTEQPEIASPTFVIGSPLDPKYEGSVISGIVSGFRDHRYGPMIQSDVNVTHGNSGGPMFDEHGNVIGLVDIGIPGQDGQATAINLFIPIADALAKLNIQANLALGAAPMLASAPAQGFAPQATQQAALSAPATREIKVMMFPAAGPVKDSGHSGALAGVAAGVGTSGTFTFARPDNVSCNGRWTTLQTKPQSGSLVDKHKQVTGLPAEVTGMVGGLAIGSCSNAASFQAEYYAVPGADSGFGAAEDSDGNIYKIIF